MKLPISYKDSHWSVRKQARLQYVEQQLGKCWYCQNLLTSEPVQAVLSKPIDHKLFPPGMFDYPVHLHHDHKSGMTIGAVHNKCNAILWQYDGQ